MPSEKSAAASSLGKASTGPHPSESGGACWEHAYSWTATGSSGHQSLAVPARCGPFVWWLSRSRCRSPPCKLGVSQESPRGRTVNRESGCRGAQGSGGCSLRSAACFLLLVVHFVCILWHPLETSEETNACRIPADIHVLKKELWTWNLEALGPFNNPSSSLFFMFPCAGAPNKQVSSQRPWEDSCLSLLIHREQPTGQARSCQAELKEL